MFMPRRYYNSCQMFACLLHSISSYPDVRGHKEAIFLHFVQLTQLLTQKHDKTDAFMVRESLIGDTYPTPSEHLVTFKMDHT